MFRLTGETRTRSGPASWWLWVLTGILGAALGWGLACQAVIKAGGHEPGRWPEAWRYADTGLPMISSADGFYFMRRAQQALEDGYAGIPPFARLTARVMQVTAQPAETVAFYMSLAFHLGLGLLAAAWGRFLKTGLFGVFLACVAAALMPGWLERAGPGRFDTDLAILFFWQLGIYFLVKTSLSMRRGEYGLANFIPAVCSFLVLSWFWKAGLGLAAGSLLIWLFLFVPLRLFSLKARLIFGAAICAWLVLLIALPPEKAPAPVAMINMAGDLFRLAFKSRPELFYSSIKELESLNFTRLMTKIGGGPAGGLALLAAGLLAAWKLPPLRLPLLLGLASILVGVRSNRFVYLGLFPLALSVGFLPAVLAGALRGGPLRLPALGCGLAAWAGIMLSCFNWASSRDLDMRWERGHDRLAGALRHEEAPGAGLWNWWDDGYFLLARSGGMRPLFDGGAQTHTMAYIAARPFMMDDRRAAARWMRFFAIRGEAGLDPLNRIWGPEAALTKLEELLSAESPEAVADDLGKIKNGADWIFPKGRVYWYMPGYFFKIANWWVPLGLSREPDRKLVLPHLETIDRNKFRYDAQTRSLTITRDLGARYNRFGLVFNTSKNPLSPPWPTSGAPYIVYSERSAKAYITDQWGIKSLPLYMMAPGGETPPNFRPLAVDEDWGGVWEILP